MARKQFTFYRSYYEALKNLPQKDQTKVFMAICAYALDDDPPTLSGVPLSVFTLIRPTLDTGRNKSLNRKNKTKSNKEQTKNKMTSNEEQMSKEREGEKEVAGEVEGDTPSTTTLLTSGSGSLPHAAVFRDDFYEFINFVSFVYPMMLLRAARMCLEIIFICSLCKNTSRIKPPLKLIIQGIKGGE